MWIRMRTNNDGSRSGRFNLKNPLDPGPGQYQWNTMRTLVFQTSSVGDPDSQDRIFMDLKDPDPDPLVSGTDSDPVPSYFS
jgi:hypothetical protein